jgi:hypothetical protein
MAENTETELGVINAALLLAGEKKLTALDTSKKSGRTADFLFEISRDICFDLPENWDFLTTTIELTEADDEPVSAWNHQYLLPSNIHRPLHMVDSTSLYIEYTHRREFYIDGASAEHDVILSNETTCFIKYIAGRDPQYWPSWFTRLVIIDMALQLVPPLKGGASRSRTSTKLERSWLSAYKLAKQINQAQGVNADDGVDEFDGNNDILDAPNIGFTRSNDGRYFFPGNIS